MVEKCYLIIVHIYYHINAKLHILATSFHKKTLQPQIIKNHSLFRKLSCNQFYFFDLHRWWALPSGHPRHNLHLLLPICILIVSINYTHPIELEHNLTLHLTLARGGVNYAKIHWPSFDLNYGYILNKLLVSLVWFIY